MITQITQHYIYQINTKYTTLAILSEDFFKGLFTFYICWRFGGFGISDLAKMPSGILA